jgi:hypothetical protein
MGGVGVEGRGQLVTSQQCLCGGARSMHFRLCSWYYTFRACSNARGFGASAKNIASVSNHISCAWSRVKGLYTRAHTPLFVCIA